MWWCPLSPELLGPLGHNGDCGEDRSTILGVAEEASPWKLGFSLVRSTRKSVPSKQGGTLLWSPHWEWRLRVQGSMGSVWDVLSKQKQSKTKLKNPFRPTATWGQPDRRRCAAQLFRVGAGRWPQVLRLHNAPVRSETINTTPDGAAMLPDLTLTATQWGKHKDLFYRPEKEGSEGLRNVCMVL